MNALQASGQPLPQLDAGPGGATGDGGRERPRRPGAVLVVEEDASLRSLIETFIAGRGFSVSTAKSVQEAVDRLRRDPPVRLVILDAALRGRLTWDQVLDRLRELAPGLSAVLLSGCAGILVDAASGRLVRVLQRPFLPRNLLRVIDELQGSPVEDAR